MKKNQNKKLDPNKIIEEKDKIILKLIKIINEYHINIQNYNKKING